MSNNSSGTPDVALSAIADSVRGSFRTVEDMAQAFIREAIHQGIFLPGERLNLDSIAATLGVSRMPVRASLRQLEAEGLVRIHPHRGARVSVLAPEEIAEIYELRTLLETYMLELAIERIDDSLLDRLEALVHELEASDDLNYRLDKRWEFYQHLYERADRPRTLSLANHLRGSIGRYLLLQRVDEHRGHEDFMGHLREGDVKAATEWLRGHLEHVSASLQQIIAQASVGAPPKAGAQAAQSRSVKPRSRPHERHQTP
jgi:DNA-binding GntR family transcriptional regulator